MNASSKATQGPDSILWNDEAHTLKEVLQSGELPLLLKLRLTDEPDAASAAHYDLQSPLLLYAKRTVRKLRAKCLAVDDTTGKHSRIGNPLAIPEDFPGQENFRPD